MTENQLNPGHHDPSGDVLDERLVTEEMVKKQEQDLYNEIERLVWEYYNEIWPDIFKEINQLITEGLDDFQVVESRNNTARTIRQCANELQRVKQELDRSEKRLIEIFKETIESFISEYQKEIDQAPYRDLLRRSYLISRFRSTFLSTYKNFLQNNFFVRPEELDLTKKYVELRCRRIKQETP